MRALQGKGKYEAVLGLVRRGLIDPTQMVTHRFSFQDAIKTFETTQMKPEGTIKVVVFS